MNPELTALADRYWDHLMSTNPTWAGLIGDHRFLSEMEDVSREAEDDNIATLGEISSAADEINPSGLDRPDGITREVLTFEAGTQAAMHQSRTAEFDVDAQLGFHVALFSYIPQIVLTEPEHAEALTEKYHKIARTFDQAIERLRQGVANRRTPPQIAVEKTIAQLEQYLASPIEADPFLTIGQPASFDEAATQEWREQLRSVIQGTIRPAYNRYRAALADHVLPAARPPDQSGVCWLDDGEEIYTRAVHRYTSLDLSPEEIHQIGLDEIDQLGDEYRQLGKAVLGSDDLGEIFGRLRDDKSLRFKTVEEVISHAEAALARAKAAIPGFFGRLPQADCVLQEVPEVGAKDAPLAYYIPPAADGSRPGTFFMNTHNAEDHTVYESEALAFHEAIPGHHLQLAIAQEVEDLPEFRKHALVTAYVEGWGLYTERLSDEMSLYSGDLERMGMLSFDSWRAGRLVVDTGMHALGWSRHQAMEFLATNTPQVEVNVENEVDRYIGFPGQALAYKIGQRELFRIRRHAQERLGERFDIKDFHDVVLAEGPVPLPVLRRLVREWVEAA